MAARSIRPGSLRQLPTLLPCSVAGAAAGAAALDGAARRRYLSGQVQWRIPLCKGVAHLQQELTMLYLKPFAPHLCVHSQVSTSAMTGGCATLNRRSTCRHGVSDLAGQQVGLHHGTFAQQTGTRKQCESAMRTCGEARMTGCADYAAHMRGCGGVAAGCQGRDTLGLHCCGFAPSSHTKLPPHFLQQNSVCTNQACKLTPFGLKANRLLRPGASA